MFCSNCGTKLEDGVKFCSNCGKSLTPQQNDESKLMPILQETLNAWIKKRFGIYEKGILTLFSDKLNWNGRTTFELSLSKISNVKVKCGLSQTLEIMDENNNPYIFGKLTADSPITMALLGSPEIAMVNSTISSLRQSFEFEVWEREINKLRQ
jgi:hypothetical protein